MDDRELRKKTIGGLAWKFAERFAAQGISFIVSLVLARILMPEEYGIVALVTVIISLCDVFVNSGLGTALIQKKDADELDYSTVFFFSFAMALVLYLVLFLMSPFIANYYQKESLICILRVMGLRMIIASLNTVQHAYVSSTMQFKKFFFSTLVGTIGSAVVGIALAVSGMGVWALIGQYMFNSVIDTIVLFFTIQWKPKLMYSWERWKQLFAYGWKLLVSSFIDTLYNNLRSLIIGKKYSSEDLAYYNKGKQFPELINSNILSSIENVLFPAIALKQDNKETVKSMVRRFIKTSSFILGPLMIGMAAVAEPMVKLLLTDKWIFCVPYIQIYCFVGFLQPIQTANQQAIKALGRSDITLKLEIVKKVFGVVLLISVMQFGVFAIAASNMVYSVIVLIINSYPNRKLLNYSIFEQLKDFAPNFMTALVMGIVVYAMTYLSLPTIVVLALQVIVGVLLYLVISKVTKNESLEYLMTIGLDCFRK